ncbi:MAG: DUF4136 domain-containing protein [Bacteroidia bacterium]|nr:MAG: DUF4136 domain-containing protein [Bacteroidia bacterium]
MKILKAISLLALVMAMVSCSSLKVAVDMEKSTDFSQYKTYSFLGWQNSSGDLLSVEDKAIMRDAFIKEFTRRGMEKVDSNGDMQVSLFIITSEETAVSGYNDYVGKGYGGYSYYGGGYGYGTSNNTYKTRSKMVGTLIMDAYDGKSKTKVWQALATGTVEKNPKNRPKSMPGKIATIMNEFPIKPEK